jgi:hypothetical protein
LVGCASENAGLHLLYEHVVAPGGALLMRLFGVVGWCRWRGADFQIKAVDSHSINSQEGRTALHFAVDISHLFSFV